MRVYRQWRLNSAIENNGEGGRAASDSSNLLEKVARSKSKVTSRWAWSGRSAEIRMGRFGSRPFGNLEKTRSGWQRENHFSASSLIEFIRSASGNKPAAG